MKFTAAGDALIQRRIPDYKDKAEISNFIARGDARFFNLETTLNASGECFASAFSGGTYVRTCPEVLRDLTGLGFNMTSFNNNHAMDFSYDGFLKTQEAVEKSGLISAGTGRNLAAASKAQYLETAAGRVALIAVNTTFDPSMTAGEGTRTFPGRPGINGLHIEKKMEVSEEELAFIRKLAEKSGINCEREHEISQGYALPDAEDAAFLGELRFERSDRTHFTQTIRPLDIRRVEDAIEEARFMADAVLISIHSHEFEGTKAEDVPGFLRDFAHRCIDLGADAVIGHGPHLLRPIEIYEGKPIFYSLGDFILQLYSVEAAPYEFYAKYGLSADESVYTLLKTRSRDFTIGLMAEARMSETVLPYWETENGKLKSLTLLPLKLSMDKTKGEEGLPFLAEDEAFMERLAEISAPYGTRMEKKNGVYICKL